MRFFSHSQVHFILAVFDRTMELASVLAEKQDCSRGLFNSSLVIHWVHTKLVDSKWELVLLYASVDIAWLLLMKCKLRFVLMK